MGGGVNLIMGRQHEKLVERLLQKPKDFTNEEVEKLLTHFGYEKDNKGMTSGSRIAYSNPKTGALFLLHRSHSPNTLRPYIVNKLIQHLKEQGLI